MKMKQNEGISLGLSMVPIGVGTGAGLAGLGYAAGKTLPSVAKLTLPVLPAHAANNIVKFPMWDPISKQIDPSGIICFSFSYLKSNVSLLNLASLYTGWEG